jgi:hypothetical protein
MNTTTKTCNDHELANYIGTKLIKAKVLTRGEFHDLAGTTLPAGEDGDDEGFLVVHIGYAPNLPGYEGYVSWLSKAQFVKAYHRTDGLSFGLAVEAVRKGKKIARAGWAASKHLASNDAAWTVTKADILAEDWKVVS